MAVSIDIDPKRLTVQPINFTQANDAKTRYWYFLFYIIYLENYKNEKYSQN